MNIKTISSILLAGLLMFAPEGVDAKTKHSKKTTKTTSVTKHKATPKKAKTKAPKASSTKSKSTTKSKASTKKTHASRHRAKLQAMHQSSRYNRSQQKAVIDVDSADSARLRHGGDYRIPLMGLAVERIANMEPMTTRFRRGDTTLTMKNIETLYFARLSKSDDKKFFGDILPKVDEAIRQSKYKEAYALAQKGLWRNPMHIGLIKRACELSEHQGDEAKSDTYVWQIAELFNLIQNTGKMSAGSSKGPTTSHTCSERMRWEVWLLFAHPPF